MNPRYSLQWPRGWCLTIGIDNAVVWSQYKAVAKRDLIRLYSAHQTGRAPEQMWGIVSTMQGLVERCCLLCSQAEGTGRRPSSLNFYFQRLPWKLGHCLRRGRAPPPRFWRQLSRRRGAISPPRVSEPTSGAALGARPRLLCNVPVQESCRDFFRFLFNFFLVDPNCARLSRLIRCIACWWGWWIWSSCEKSGSIGGEGGQRCQPSERLLKKQTLIDFYEVLGGQRQSVINPHYQESKERMHICTFQS